MKTPEEIKQGLKHCAEDGCKGCNYEYECNMADGFSTLAYDALAYIQQLEATLPQPPEEGEHAIRTNHQARRHHHNQA